MPPSEKSNIAIRPLQESTLPSGATLGFLLVPFELGEALTAQYMLEADLDPKLDPEFKTQLDGESLADFQKRVDAERSRKMGQQTIKMVTSSRSYQEVFKRILFKSCMYNGAMITPALLEGAAIRRDYYPIALEVFQYVTGPFLEGLALMAPAVASTPKI